MEKKSNFPILTHTMMWACRTSLWFRIKIDMEIFCYSNMTLQWVRHKACRTDGYRELKVLELQSRTQCGQTGLGGQTTSRVAGSLEIVVFNRGNHFKSGS